MQEFLEKNKLILVMALIGLLLLGIGVFSFKLIKFDSGAKVEILGTTDGGEGAEAGSLITKEKKITVEISGEVIKPGVYDLPEGSRVNDLLIKGGGVSANANRDYLAKSINLAQKLSDGVKIYIPGVSEAENLKVEAGTGAESGIVEKININTASLAELDTLYGVGQVTAQKIIDARPYQSIEELAQRKIIKSNVWEAIKDKVTVW